MPSLLYPSYSDVLAEVISRYNALLIQVRVCCHELGYNSPQSALNAISKGTFQIPTFPVSRKRMVRACDLAAFVHNPNIQFPKQEEKKRRRGRLTKAESIEMRK